MPLFRSHQAIGIILFLLSLQGFAQKIAGDTTKLKLGPLFKKEEILEFKLVTNFAPLMKDRKSAKQPNNWAKLENGRKKKGDVSLKIRVKVRGNFRRFFRQTPVGNPIGFFAGRGNLYGQTQRSQEHLPKTNSDIYCGFGQHGDGFGV